MEFAKRIACVVAIASALVAAAPAAAEDVAGVELYFLERPQFPGCRVGCGDYWFYHLTTSRSEMAGALASGQGWREWSFRDAAFVYDRWVDGTVPFYRFLNSEGNHFFTASRPEALSAMQRYGYRSEGICCYIAATQLPGTVPLYRLRRPIPPHVHRYLIDQYEKDRLIAADGYVNEGIAGYVWTTAVTRTVQPGQPEPLQTPEQAAKGVEAARR